MSEYLDSLPILPKQGEVDLQSFDQGSALFQKDVKVISIDHDSNAKEEQKTEEDMDPQGMKELFATLVENAVELIPGVGSVLSPIISKVLGNFLDIPDKQDLLQKSLDSVERKIDALDKQGKENLSAIFSSDGLSKLKSNESHLNALWRAIRDAKETGDPRGFKKAIERIDEGNSVSSWLEEADDSLRQSGPRLQASDGTSLNKSSLQFVHSLLKDRLESDSHSSNYTILDYESDVQAWLDWFSEIQLKGAALRVIYQESRMLLKSKNGSASKVSKETVQGMVKRILDTCNDRMDSYKKALLGGVLDYPSTRLFKELTQNDPTTSYPDLYHIKHEATGRLFKIGRAMCSKKPIMLTSERASGESFWKSTGADDAFTYKDVEDPKDFSSSFGLVFNKDQQTWALRGSRYNCSLDHPSQWTVCRDDEDGKNNNGVEGERLGLFGRNFASFKLIPLNSAAGEDPLFLLVVWDKDGSSRLKSWKVRLQKATFTDTLMMIDADKIQVNPKFARKISFQIENHASPDNKKYLCLLQDARVACSSPPFGEESEFGRVYASGLIWLPNRFLKLIWAGGASKLEGSQFASDFKGLVKLRVYQLQGDRDASDPKTFSNLLWINPKTGKLDLKSEGAKALEDVFIKVENPTGMSWNAVSTVTVPCDDACGDLPADGSLHAEELGNALEKSDRRVTQNDTGRFDTAYLKIAQTISGGSRECNGTVALVSL